MRCSTKYVGLDVHQATTSATVRDSGGKIIARSILPTEEAAVLAGDGRASLRYLAAYVFRVASAITASVRARTDASLSSTAAAGRAACAR